MISTILILVTLTASVAGTFLIMLSVGYALDDWYQNRDQKTG